MSKVSSLLFLALGLSLILVGVFGFFQEEVLFIGRDGILRLLGRKSDQLLYWFVETFYVFGGGIIFLFGLKEYRTGEYDI